MSDERLVMSDDTLKLRCTMTTLHTDGADLEGYKNFRKVGKI